MAMVQPPVKSSRKLLGVRATAAEQRVLVKAAARAHRSLSSFVLSAALEAAKSKPDVAEAEPARSKRSLEDVKALLQAARAEVQAALPEDHDLLREFLAERRVAAARE